MKKLVLGTALAALVASTAAFACEDEHETAAKETKKTQPVAQKSEKKPVKAQKKADRAADKSTVAQADKR